MSRTFQVAVIVGSLRSASISRQIATALIDRAPKSMALRMIEIGDLPLYNQDLDEKPPTAWTRFREEVGACDAILFVTPEYNRSLPGCLKNALDVGSRPEGKSIFPGLPAAVVSVTPYKLGAFGANHALRQTFVFLDMPVMQQPEAYIGNAGDLFDDQGKLTSKETSDFLTGFANRFADWIAATGKRGGGFDEFLAGDRDAAARAYADGDAVPLGALVTTRDPATFFAPTGGLERGARAVADRYAADAKSFVGPGESRLEVAQADASGSLAFWTGYQHAKVRMKGEDEPRDMSIRITEVFRREGGAWKLVHRHADTTPDPAGR